MIENLVKNQDRDLSHKKERRKLMLNIGSGMERCAV